MFARRLLVLLTSAVLLGGCSASPDTSGPLPDGTGLVREATAAMGNLNSVHFRFGISGVLAGLDVLEVEGDASRTAGSRGRAVLLRSTNRFEYQYVLDGGSLTMTDQNGETHTEPAPIFTPERLLDDATGLPRLLSGATELQTEGREKLGEVEAYRVTAKVPRAVISAVVPTIQVDVDAKFWVEEAPSRNLARVWLQVPPSQPNEGAIMLELALTRVNTPAT